MISSFIRLFVFFLYLGYHEAVDYILQCFNLITNDFRASNHRRWPICLHCYVLNFMKRLVNCVFSEIKRLMRDELNL